MDTQSKTFPRELLLRSKKERFDYFKDKVIGHDRLLEVDKKLLHAIRYPVGKSLILVYGPTGVGKTTLRTRIEQKLLELEMEAMQKDPGYLPIVSMEAIAASRSYDWKEHFTRALVAANEPLIDYKIDYEARKSSQGRDLVKPTTRSELVLRRSLESCLRHRRTKVFIIDEAQHLNKVRSGHRLLDQMDIIKSLAETTNTIHVLIGTYELLSLTSLSAQLCRRGDEIHFSRYHNHDDTDKDAFASVLETFQRYLPLAQTPDLLSFEDFFYEKTFGCIGVLKALLNSALAMALEKDEDTITEKMLRECALPARDLIQMSREIVEGEGVLRETNEQIAELHMFLTDAPNQSKSRGKTSRDDISTQTNPASKQKQDNTCGASQPTPNRVKRGRIPGERNAKRDKVGVKK
ncbi:ATP-binding protein [Ktedonobacter sp. SOSP1-52]|uniref:AAA family ATPase n=1 Tax=Ktedonobacter sp. SOSP1-52 TaxID=2778366 RepID=UPI001915105B|nr:ATP-binding protein [Ktedonobacter sp. SOSP1-52]GHO67428.1 ATP-binding protein [Ktedonobacter sp. SOSP1-52]